jgi:tetratricopeptide (TPR) repeat protein
LKQNPADVKGLILSSKLAFLKKDYLKAKQFALIAQKWNPIHPKIYLLLGDILLEEGKIKDAKTLYESATKLAKLKEVKVTALAYDQLSKIHTLLGDKKAAQENKLLSQYYLTGNAKDSQISALAEKKEYVANYFKDQGKILEQENKIPESILFYQAASLVQPNNGAVFVERGEVSEKMAASYVDFQRISQMYRKAIEVDPRLVKAYVKLGLLQTEQYNLKEALDLLTKAQMLAPDNKDVAVALGKHYFKRQDYTEALNYFLKSAKINQNDSETLYYAGVIRLFFKKGSQKEAAQFFSRAYQNDSKNYDALVEWMKLKVELYEKNFAIKFIRTLQKNDPENPNFHWVMGEIYAVNKEYRRAIDFFHKSLDIDNRSSKVRLSLAKSLEAIGELSNAIAEYKLASLLDPRQGEGFYKAAELYYQLKNYNKSEETIKNLVKVTPNYPGAYRYLSKIYQVRNQRELAVEAFKKEVSNNPQNTKYRIELSELYMSYDIWDSAIAELTEITNLPSLKKAPEYIYDKITAYLLLSRCYRAQNKYDSAEGVIKLAIELDNQDPTLRKELGYVYQGLNRDREAYQAFDFYLKRMPAAQDSQQLKSIMQHLVIED